MRKLVDIDETILPRLKMLAALENTSVKGIIEDAVLWYLNHKQEDYMKSLSSIEKEDMILMMLMHKTSDESTVTEKELFET